MSTFWRQVGMNYIEYSAICSRIVKQCLKPEFRPADVPLVSAIKVTKWVEGKPVADAGQASAAK